MVRRVSDREAGMHFGEIADRVRQTGEPVIVEKHGESVVALVSLTDLDELERLRAEQRAAAFSRHAAEAAREAEGPEPTDEEIVEAVKRTREELYRERYG